MSVKFWQATEVKNIMRMDKNYTIRRTTILTPGIGTSSLFTDAVIVKGWNKEIVMLRETFEEIVEDTEFEFELKRI